MEEKREWKIIEEDGHYLRLCRKADPAKWDDDIYEIAAVRVRVSKWIRPRAGKIRVPMGLERTFLSVRDVPYEEAIAIILSADKAEAMY